MMPATTFVLNDDGTITQTRIIPAEMDLIEAAEMLGVDSRSDVIDFISAGRLQEVRKHHHTFVNSHEVFALRADLLAQRNAAFQQLLDLEG